MSEEDSGFDPTIKAAGPEDVTKDKDATPDDDASAKPIIGGESASGEDESSKKTDDREATEDVDGDLSKLKKKKKKSSFKFDGLGDDTTTPGEHDEIGKTGAEAAFGKGASKLNSDDLDDVDFAKLKKKKKKKTGFNLESLGDALEAGNEGDAGPATGEEASVAEQVADEEDIDDLDFNNMKKKKKKKKVIFGDDIILGEDRTDLDSQLDGTLAPDGAGTKSDDPSGAVGGNDAWRGSDRDYSYEELLQRVFNLMKEKNPDMVAGDKRKLVMKPPQVIRVGTKKTSFANFLEITRTLRRAPKHLQAFLMAEMGTSGSIDANNQLIIKGRFQQKQIEHILRRYIKEYVTCHTCRAPETILEKDTRINFLRCEKCGSRCSVQSIKSGFQAVTTKRAAMRARAT